MVSKVRPCIYLDFDGVVNFFGETEFPDSETALATFPPRKLVVTLNWSPTLIKELNSLPVDIVWLTTWRDYAVEILEPIIGLKSSRVLQWEHKFSDYNQSFKFIALKEDQAENPRPFIWLEDYATHSYYNNKFHKPAIKAFPPHLVIMPDDEKGLTPTHIQEIKDFLVSVDK